MFKRKDKSMSKINIADWRTIVKLIIALATAILGALGAGEVAGNE
jgi:hypothetical protein